MITPPIDLSFFAFPASLILAVVYVLGLWVLVRYYSDIKVFKLLSSVRTAILTTLVLLLFVMIDGIWALNLHSTWYFFVIAFVFMTALGVTCIRRCYTNFRWPFFLNHVGLFLVCWAMFFGAADRMDLRMVAEKGKTVQYAMSANGALCPLPFSVGLKNFEVEYYDDGVTPFQYRSLLLIDGGECEVSVNHPIHIKGYKIYQNSFDKEHGQYSVLQLVYDRWLIVVYIGMVFLALGALFLIISKKW